MKRGSKAIPSRHWFHHHWPNSCIASSDLLTIVAWSSTTDVSDEWSARLADHTMAADAHCATRSELCENVITCQVSFRFRLHAAERQHIRRRCLSVSSNHAHRSTKPAICLEASKGQV